MVKRCTTRTVLGMLNQAAQKFIFMLEKNYHGFWGGTCPLCPPPWIRHWYRLRIFYYHCVQFENDIQQNAVLMLFARGSHIVATPNSANTKLLNKATNGIHRVSSRERERERERERQTENLIRHNMNSNTMQYNWKYINQVAGCQNRHKPNKLTTLWKKKKKKTHALYTKGKNIKNNGSNKTWIATNQMSTIHSAIVWNPVCIIVCLEPWWCYEVDCVGCNTEPGLSAHHRAIYEAYYNRSLSSSSDRDLDLAPTQNVSNQTTTPAVTLEPLNLTAVAMETAPVIDIVHEPFQHSVCSPDACIGCARSLPNDSTLTTFIYFTVHSCI